MSHPSKRITQQELESYLWGAAVLLRGLIDAIQKPVGNPLHHRLPYCILGREMAKQRALRHVHVVSDGRCRDLAGVLLPGQGHDRIDRHRAPFIGG